MGEAEATRPGRLGPSFQWTRVIFIAGITLWLGSMLVQTRLNGVVALGTAALLLGGLLLITLPVRSVTAKELISPLCLGGAMLGLAVVAGWIIDAAAVTSRGRDLIVPLVEEVLKILPVLWILWRQRNGRAKTFGVADVLLIAAACGVGFGLVEEAFIRQNEGWARPLWWLPTSEILQRWHGVQLIAGHGAWTAVAGLTVGFALLLRRPRVLMIMVAPLGLIWSVIDHAGVNYGNANRDALGAALRAVNGDGWFTAYLLLGGVVAAILLDLYLVHLSRRKLPEEEPPVLTLSFGGLRTWWTFERARRQFAYSVARYQRQTGLARARSAVVAAGLSANLVNWQLWWREAGARKRVS